MAFKFLALFALVAVASAQHYQNDYYQQHNDYHHQPQYYQQAPAVIKSIQPAVIKQVVQPTLVKKVIEHEAPANYEFNYDVHDHHTGDIKQQHEKAHEGSISGQYSLIDADGYRRIVDYTADDHHGFQANVRREPVEGHKIIKQVEPVVVKKIVAQPAIAVQKYVAPVQHHYSAPAPVQHHYSAPAPVHHYSAPAPVHHYSAPAPVHHYAAPTVVKQVAPVHKTIVSAPVQHHYVEKHVAPVVEKYVSAPVVHKTISAPVQHHYSAPAPVHHYSAPVQHYAAPAVVKTAVVAAPVTKYTTADHSHVSFSSGASNYHY